MTAPRFEYEETACPVCGAAEYERRFEVRRLPDVPLRFVTCVRCGLLYQTPRLTERALADLFSSDVYRSAQTTGGPVYGYYDYLEGEGFRRSMAIDRLRLLARYWTGDKPAIFEAGCATGTFLDAARAEGHEVAGADVSRFFVEYARQTYGLDVFLGPVERFPDVRRFGVACIWGSLSSFARPVDALGRIHALLDPGGILALNYPGHAAWSARLAGAHWGMLAPSSVAIYHRPSLEALFERTGFELLVHRTDVQHTSVLKIAGFLKSRKAGRLAQRLGAGSLTFRMPTPGVYLAIARRRGDRREEGARGPNGRESRRS